MEKWFPRFLIENKYWSEISEGFCRGSSSHVMRRGSTINYTPSSKMASKEWRNKNDVYPTKEKIRLSAGNVLRAIVFFFFFFFSNRSFTRLFSTRSTNAEFGFLWLVVTLEMSSFFMITPGLRVKLIELI